MIPIRSISGVVRDVERGDLPFIFRGREAPVLAELLDHFPNPIDSNIVRLSPGFFDITRAVLGQAGIKFFGDNRTPVEQRLPQGFARLADDHGVEILEINGDRGALRFAHTIGDRSRCVTLPPSAAMALRALIERNDAGVPRAIVYGVEDALRRVGAIVKPIDPRMSFGSWKLIDSHEWRRAASFESVTQLEPVKAPAPERKIVATFPINSGDDRKLFGKYHIVGDYACQAFKMLVKAGPKGRRVDDLPPGGVGALMRGMVALTHCSLDPDDSGSVSLELPCEIISDSAEAA